MQVYPNRFDETLTRGLRQVYLVFGDEPQQKMQIIQQIRESAMQQGFDERQSLVADNQFQWNNLLEATQSLSLFSSRQFIELELPTGKPGTEGAKLLSELANQLGEDILLVIHGGKIGRDVQNTKWFKALDKQGIYVPCYPLEGRQLHQWVLEQMRVAGLQPDPQNAQLVADFCEGNLLAAKQEIEKLALLFPDGKVTPDAIEQAVVDQSRFNVFQLVDVLLSGDPQRAVKLLFRLESEGVEPTIILWALVREWQTLNSLMHLQARRETIQWNKFRIWKTRQPLYQSALRRLSQQHLDAMQQKLAVMDRAIKGTAVMRPYVELCHLCLMFVPMSLEGLPLE